MAWGSLVGTDGAQAVWLLAQHADAEPAFQRRCLDLLTAAVEAGEATAATARHLAYLTDRVLLHEGEPQVYGTQMTRRGGRTVPRDLGDPDRVDERRAAVGLGPLADYQRRFDDNPVPMARLRCPGCAALVPFEPPDEGESVTVTCAECRKETIITGPVRRAH